MQRWIDGSSCRFISALNDGGWSNDTSLRLSRILIRHYLGIFTLKYQSLEHSLIMVK